MVISTSSNKQESGFSHNKGSNAFLQAQENLGMVMVFTLVSAVQEKLSCLVDEAKKRKTEEAERKRKEIEDAEHVRKIDRRTNELCREKIYLRRFRPGPTQTRLKSHRKWLEAGNFGFRM